MSDNTTAGEGGASRFWLLDFFGEVLDHDQLQDQLVTRPLSLKGYPGIFFYADQVDVPPFPVHLRKAVSLPMPLPSLRAAATGKPGLIALEVLPNGETAADSAHFMTSAHYGQFRYDTKGIAGWEHFLPLSEPLLHALVILANGELSAIRAEADGQDADPLPPLTLAHDHHATLGGQSFFLPPNIRALEEIAALSPGDEHTLTLESGAGPRSFTVARN